MFFIFTPFLDCLLYKEISFIILFAIAIVQKSTTMYRESNEEKTLTNVEVQKDAKRLGATTLSIVEL